MLHGLEHRSRRDTWFETQNKGGYIAWSTAQDCIHGLPYRPRRETWFGTQPKNRNFFLLFIVFIHDLDYRIRMSVRLGTQHKKGDMVWNTNQERIHG